MKLQMAILIFVLTQHLKIGCNNLIYPSFVLLTVLVFAVRTRLRCPGFVATLGVVGILSPPSVD